MTSIQRAKPTLFVLVFLLTSISSMIGCTRSGEEPTSKPDPAQEPNAIPELLEPTAIPEPQEPVELMGMVVFETGYRYGGTEVGGLSGITYDPFKEQYYVISDDKGQGDAPRFYVMDIDTADGNLDRGDVTLIDVVTLLDENGDKFQAGSIDGEGIELVGADSIYISSEGNLAVQPNIPPFVDVFNGDGERTSSLTIPEKYLPNSISGTGIRANKAFESLTSTPDGERLYTALENALLQDGPEARFTAGSPSRLLEFTLEDSAPAREFVYMVEPIPVKPDQENAHADNGLVDLQALDDEGMFLALERSYVEGYGNTVKIFITSIEGASDVSSLPTLEDGGESEQGYVPMTKMLLIDIAELGIQPDNLEAMAFGPDLSDGRNTLILVSDNNFNPSQTTQVIALALALEAP